MTSEFPLRRSVDALATVLLSGGLLFLFLLGVRSVGESPNIFGHLGGPTSNPLIAFLIGLLSTTLIQSSTITASIVMAVAAAPENPLPVAAAVPMIMGANIGMTFPRTLAFLGHSGRKVELRRAFAVNACSDFFSFFTALTLLPLELATGCLQKTASWIADSLAYRNPVEGAVTLGVTPFRSAATGLFPDAVKLQGVMIAILGAVLVAVALLALVGVLRSAMPRAAEFLIETSIGGGSLAILVGVVATVLVQSSSRMTSLLVTLAGAGLLTLSQAFPITLGANIGATATVLFATLAVSGPHASAGLAIALVHTLFNLAGALSFYPFPPLRRLPLIASEALAELASRSPARAIAWPLVLFYVAPAMAALLYEIAR